jgi:hypothetical protein
MGVARDSAATVERERAGAVGARVKAALPSLSSLDRSQQVALGGLGILLSGAILLRAWLVFDHGQAFLGFPDSTVYVEQAAGVHLVRLTGWSSLFGLQKPAGYPLFLATLHLFTDDLRAPILVQHLLGLATGVLLYAAVRRTGAPPYLGLLPAAIVFFGGTGVFLEHALLSEAPFAFVQAVSVYAAIRAMSEPRLRWPVLAGLAIGVSFWIRPTGISSAFVVPPVLLFAAWGTRRQRLLSAATAAAVAIVMVVGYVAAQGLLTGFWGYERLGGLSLYGRVATFVDCSKFTPPAGTKFLCPAEPVGHRQSQNYYEYDPTAPVRHFPAPYGSRENGLMKKFSVAAIEQEPIAYVKAVLHGLTFYISPRAGENYTPESIRESMLGRPGNDEMQPLVRKYYPHSHAANESRSIASLAFYESHTRVEGVFLIVLLVLAIVGTVLLGAACAGQRSCSCSQLSSLRYSPWRETDTTRATPTRRSAYLALPQPSAGGR